MDVSQLQAMHAYIQQLNFQTASAVASSTTPNLLATTNSLINQNLINNNNNNNIPPPATTVTNDSNNLNSFTALALLYANQQKQQNSANNANNHHVQVQHPQQPQQQSHIQFQIPPVTTSTMPSLTFPQQQQPSAATSTMYNPNIQIRDLQAQIEQQAMLNQLSQLIGSLGHPQIAQPQIGNIYTPPQHPQQQQPIFHHQPLHQHNQQHQQQQNASVSSMMPIMSKPPILTPSQPIQIPKHSQLPRSSLPSSTPENIRKRRHRDVEMISQPSSQSGSPNNSIILNNNNNNLINDKFSRSRAFTCPETMKQQQQQQPSVKEQSVHPSSPDKIAKFDPSCPLRHHPDNLSPPNTQAMMLEQLTTAYILNALGESAYRTSDPTTITKDENKSKQLDNGMQLKTNTTKEINEKSGSIVKIPMSEIHRMIEDCYNDL